MALDWRYQDTAGVGEVCIAEHVGRIHPDLQIPGIAAEERKSPVLLETGIQLTPSGTVENVPPLVPIGTVVRLHECRWIEPLLDGGVRQPPAADAVGEPGSGQRAVSVGRKGNGEWDAGVQLPQGAESPATENRVENAPLG